MGAFYQDWAASVTRTPFGGLFRGGFESLTLAQSHLLLFFILSGCLLALGTLAISLGPVHSLAPRLNTFGEAILPGDAKRSTWLKRRLNLRRNAELCFLYENHSPAWRQADFRRRWLLREVVFFLFLGAGLLWLHWLFTPAYYADAFFPLHTLLFGGAVLLNTTLFCEGWPSERLVTHRWEAGHINRASFAGNLLLIWLIFAWLPQAWGLDLTPLKGRLAALAHLAIQERNFLVISLLMLPATAFYGIARAITLNLRTKEIALTLALLWMLLIALMPSTLEILVNLNQDPDDPRRMPWLSMGNPFEAVVELMWNSRVPEAAIAPGIVFYLVLYTGLVAGSFTLAHRRRRRQIRRHVP